VEFTPPADKRGLWRITSDRCALEFMVESRRKHERAATMMSSLVTQYNGQVDGHLRFPDSVLQIQGLYGVLELQDAQW